MTMWPPPLTPHGLSAPYTLLTPHTPALFAFLALLPRLRVPHSVSHTPCPTPRVPHPVFHTPFRSLPPPFRRLSSAGAEHHAGILARVRLLQLRGLLRVVPPLQRYGTHHITYTLYAPFIHLHYHSYTYVHPLYMYIHHIHTLNTSKHPCKHPCKHPVNTL